MSHCCLHSKCRDSTVLYQGWKKPLLYSWSKTLESLRQNIQMLPTMTDMTPP